MYDSYFSPNKSVSCSVITNVSFEVLSQNHGKRLLPSLCLSVCPSACVSARVHGTTRLQLDRFSWRLIFGFFFFENLSRKYKFHLIRVTATLHEDVCTFFIISRSVLLRVRSFWDKICCRGYQNTHIMSFLLDS